MRAENTLTCYDRGIEAQLSVPSVPVDHFVMESSIGYRHNALVHVMPIHLHLEAQKRSFDILGKPRVMKLELLLQ
jgi:hypothetical protein